MKKNIIFFMTVCICFLVAGCSLVSSQKENEQNVYNVNQLLQTGNKVDLESTPTQFNLFEEIELEEDLNLQIKAIRYEHKEHLQIPNENYLILNYTITNNKKEDVNLSNLNLEILDNKGNSHYSTFLLEGKVYSNLEDVEKGEEFPFEVLYNLPILEDYKVKVNLGSETIAETTFKKESIEGF